MKCFGTILLAGILGLLSVSTVAAQKEFPVSILFDLAKIKSSPIFIGFEVNYNSNFITLSCHPP